MGQRNADFSSAQKGQIAGVFEAGHQAIAGLLAAVHMLATPLAAQMALQLAAPELAHAILNSPNARIARRWTQLLIGGLVSQATGFRKSPPCSIFLAACRWEQ